MQQFYIFTLLLW